MSHRDVEHTYSIQITADGRIRWSLVMGPKNNNAVSHHHVKSAEAGEISLSVLFERSESEDPQLDFGF